MKLHFRTNLDGPKGTSDIYDLNRAANDQHELIIPRKGDLITFTFRNYYGGRDLSYELEVCSVSYDYPNGRIEVDLHMPSYYNSMSIADWSEWFARHRLGRQA